MRACEALPRCRHGVVGCAGIVAEHQLLLELFSWCVAMAAAVAALRVKSIRHVALGYATVWIVYFLSAVVLVLAFGWKPLAQELLRRPQWPRARSTSHSRSTAFCRRADRFRCPDCRRTTHCRVSLNVVGAPSCRREDGDPIACRGGRKSDWLLPSLGKPSSRLILRLSRLLAPSQLANSPFESSLEPEHFVT